MVQGCPDQDKLAARLSREDLFTVVSDHFLTDTARYADIVLPATTQLEQHDIMFSWGHLYVTLNTPAIAPLGEAVSNTELFRRLAARMGLTDPCFTRTDEEMMAEAFDWSSPLMEGITLDSLRETGWARLALPGPDEFAPTRRETSPPRPERPSSGPRWQRPQETDTELEAPAEPLPQRRTVADAMVTDVNQKKRAPGPPGRVPAEG